MGDHPAWSSIPQIYFGKNEAAHSCDLEHSEGASTCDPPLLRPCRMNDRGLDLARSKSERQLARPSEKKWTTVPLMTCRMNGCGLDPPHGWATSLSPSLAEERAKFDREFL